MLSLRRRPAGGDAPETLNGCRKEGGSGEKKVQ